jgi:hypothetical protein
MATTPCHEKGASMRKVTRKHNKRGAIVDLVRFACVVGVSLPAIGLAAPWEYGVNVDLGVIYTDNVFLANDGLEESETVFTIAPEFFLTKDSDRLNANLRYRPEAYFYSEYDDANGVFHVLDASLTAALVKERLFLYLSATNSQSIITPEGRLPRSNLPISANRVDSSVFQARPYWQQRIGQATLLLEVGYVALDYDSDLYQSSNERSGRFRLDNIERQQGIAWGLEYRYRQVEYDISPPWEFQRAGLDLGFWINGTARLFGVGGVETSFDDIHETNSDEHNMDAEFWEAGIQYTPNQRMNLELATGERSYGTSYRGDFSYTLRRGTISATYDEGPGIRSDAAFDTRPILDEDDLDNILDEPGATDRFLRRRGEIRANIELSKSDLTLRVFSETREQRTTEDGTPVDDQDYAGAAIRWSWNVGTKTMLGLGADIGKRNQGTRRDEFLRWQIDLAYSFSQKTSVRLEAVQSRQDDKDSGTFDYTENQLRLLLGLDF